MTHILKTDPCVFRAFETGIKRFEIRYDDRNFQIGDNLHLKETRYSGEEMKEGNPLEYTGYEDWMKVRYILRGPCYGLQAGWVIMS